MKRLQLLSAVLATGWLAGCGQAALESNLAQACMKQNNPEVNETMCKCMARGTVEGLPPKFQQAMLLDMEGKKQQAQEILGDLSFEERAKFGMKQFEIVGNCMGMTPPG